MQFCSFAVVVDSVVGGVVVVIAVVSGAIVAGGAVVGVLVGGAVVGVVVGGPVVVAVVGSGGGGHGVCDGCHCCFVILAAVCFPNEENHNVACLDVKLDHIDV